MIRRPPRRPAELSQPRPRSASSASVSSRNHQVDRLGALALLVRFDLERNALSLCQILQSGPLDGGDVNEHIAATVIGLDEAVAALSIEELDRTSHGHRETPPPYCSAATPNMRIGRPDIRCRKPGHLSRSGHATDRPGFFLGLDHSAATIRGSGT